MRDIDTHVAGASGPPEATALARIGARLGTWARRVDLKECECVVRLSSCRQWLRRLAVGLNHLGNGWLYVPVTLMVLLSGDARRSQIVLAAALSAGCAHLIYPLIKRLARRRRPFARDPALVCLSRPLDRYSFPSGHCMTFTTVLAPVAVAFPRTAPLVVGVWMLIAWARLASAHHYPSDVLAGTVLGALVAWPFTVLIGH